MYLYQYLIIDIILSFINYGCWLQKRFKICYQCGRYLYFLPVLRADPRKNVIFNNKNKSFKRAYNLEKKKESKFTYTLILINGQALFSMLTGYLVKRFVYKLNSPQIKLTESI